MRALFPVVLVLVACRPELGPAAYPDFEPWTDPDDPFLEGNDPYELGEDRLSIGRFYESEASEVVVIDDTVNHYYIYENTYADTPSDDRIEGLVASRLVLLDLPWWGGGVHWDSPRDLSDWTTYHLSLKATDPVFEAFEIGMVGGDVEGRVAAVDHGFAADGEWHDLVIPLADLTASGVDLSRVTVALLLISDAATPGAELLLDNVYLTQE
jgi:hypothetical protein